MGKWPTPEQAKAGRARMKTRCVEVAVRATPDSVVLVRPRTSLTGRAVHWGGRVEQPLYWISAPRPFTRRSLYVYLHEVAHVVLGHLHSHPGRENWEVEQEAERWAQAKMREEGLAVPRAEQRDARRYVASIKRKDQRRKWRRATKA